MMHFYDLSGVVPGRTRIAFGSFDGMHIGHQAVIKKLHGYEGLTPVLVSFSDEVNPIIYSECEKEYLLKGQQVSVMISLSQAKVDAMNANNGKPAVSVKKRPSVSFKQTPQNQLPQG